MKTVDPLWVVVSVTVYYSVIFVSGMVGNSVACLVIARNKHMHTITNYYLFSMAVSDMLLLLSGLPHETYFMWNSTPYVFGNIGCFLYCYLVETSYNATALTITAFTVERYLAICHPFLSHTVNSLSRAVVSITFIWLFAFLSALPQALKFGKWVVQHNSTDGEVSFCTMKNESLASPLRYSIVISSLLFFVVPLMLITVLYTLIGLQLYSASRGSLRAEPVAGGSPSNQLNNAMTMNISSGNHHSRSTKRVIKMLVAVVVAFFICWAPFQAQRLLAILQQPDMRDKNARFMYYFSGLLYFSSTTVNPILYNIMSRKFREAFMRTLTCPGSEELNSSTHRTSLKALRSSKVNFNDSKRSYTKVTIDLEQHPLPASFEKCAKQDSLVSNKTTTSTISTDTQTAV